MRRDRLWLGLRWAAIAAAVALLTLLIFDLHDPHLPRDILRISSADFIASDDTVPPVEAADWQRVQLPHDWRRRRVDAALGWYRVTLEFNVAPDRLWAAYLPALNMNAALQLNGELLGDGGPFATPAARNWNRPLYLTITNGLLRPGPNVIHIRLQAEPGLRGLLGPVYFGPDEVFAGVHAQRHLLRYTASQVIVVLLLTMAVFMAVLWHRRRRDTFYLWFALAVGTWGVHNLNLAVVDIPMPTRTWDWLMAVSLCCFPIFATLFNHRFLGLQRPRLERLLYLEGGAVAALLLVVDDRWFYVLLSAAVNPLALAVGLYPVTLLFVHFWRSPRVEVLILLTSGLLLIVLAVHDALVDNHVISRVDGFFMHFSAPLVLAGFAVILLRRFVDALNESEALNLQLEQRVDEKSRELEGNYSRLRTLERDRVLAEERSRMMRDMHDGIGGHLVSTLALLEDEKVSPTAVHAAVESALEDLRLMIDSMDDVGGDLLGVLGMLRDRIEPRLKSAGLTLHWRVRELPRFPDLGPHKALQVMRILQEALTNVIRHAAARNVTLSTGSTSSECQPGVFVELCDDGQGFAHPRRGGRGLGNMRQRADSIGARLDVSGDGAGTRVYLWLPLAKRAAAPD